MGSQRDLTYTITNSGNATLTVTGTTISGGLSTRTTFSWTSGQIAAGASQPVTVRFSPASSGSHSGTISVNGDHTSGSNTVAISGTAAGPAFAGTWSGRYVVERCDGTGSVQDYFCSQRGFYPPGTDLPLSLSLSQNGTSVSGTFSLGQVTGSELDPISWTVSERRIRCPRWQQRQRREADKNGSLAWSFEPRASAWSSTRAGRWGPWPASSTSPRRPCARAAARGRRRRAPRRRATSGP